MTNSKTVAIIGAGPGGLTAAKAMKEAGLVPRVFEAADEIGGLWRPAGATWAGMRTNLSKWGCAFSDFPWPREAPVFPRSEDVHGYLRRYAEKFGLMPEVELGRRVESVERLDGGWRVDGEVFDHLVIASGIFARPHLPAFDGQERFEGEILHAEAYPGPEAFADRRVLVVGSAFSGVEMAAEIAARAETVVHHVRRPVWVVPRVLAAQPIDLLVYRRALSLAERDLAPEEVWARRHGFLAETLGDPGAVHPALAIDRDAPPHVALTDAPYLERVRSGAIVPVGGEITGFDTGGVTFSDGSRHPVDRVLFCTGYRPDPGFLMPKQRAALEFDPDDWLQPLILHKCTFHPAFPGGAFVGLYRGPYFTVMELQARWAAGVFSGRCPEPRDMAAGLAAERAIRAARPRPQFPHGDFPALADDLAVEAGVMPDLTEELGEGPLLSAHYRLRGPHADPVAARAVIDEVRGYQEAQARAQAVFQVLEGSWSFEREISDQGTISGTATLTRRDDGALFYREDGIARLNGGQELTVYREYLYRLDEDGIAVHFVEGRRDDRLFHRLEMAVNEKNPWPVTARGYHLCSQDHYDAEYRFDGPDRFHLTYRVEGPRKGYVSTTRFVRS